MISGKIVNGEKLQARAEGMAKVGLNGVSCTHEWEGTILHVTSASGTSSADLKGDKGKQGDPGYTPVKGVDYFDGKGVSVADVKESTENGGANVVTFSDGTKLTVMNGTKGADGTMTFEELTPEQKASLKGEDGKDGTSVTISKITESTADGGSNVITFSDGETMTVKNGSRGEQGFSGVYVGDGDMPEGYNVQIIPDGTPDYDPGSGTGEDGATFIPSVSEDGVISWTNDKGLPNPDPVDISGKDGKDGYTPKKGVDYFDGKDGKDGEDGKDGYTPVKGVDYFDGEDGKDGSNGKDGYTPVKGVDYFDGVNGKDGSNGKDGTSVTVTNVTESSADGGSNVVTFSDGKTLTVKNGSKGSKGDTYTLTSADKVEIRDEIISSIITQEAGQSTKLVMSQKTVTDLVANAIGSGGGGTSTEYETVDSVDEMTDTSKQYVLKETGTIWTYGEVSGDVNEQIFDASKLLASAHMSGKNIVGNGTYKVYVMPLDTSQIPEGIDAYLNINGLYGKASDNPTPQIQKIAYSALESPIIANNQIIINAYAESGSGYLGDAIEFTDTGCRIKVGYIEGKKIDGYDTVKTVLLETLTTADVSSVTVYLQYSGTVTKWYDTGLAPSASGGGGGNYVELLVKVNQNKTDIEEVSNRVTALETGSDTVTVPTFWQNAVDVCISKIKALQIGRNCVTFPFFSDNHQRNGQPQYMGMLIAHIMKECNIPYCFFGGDSISNGTIADEATMIAQDKAFDTAMSYIPNGRFCRAVGNHDGFWNDGTNKYYYNRDQVYDLFLREESIAQNKHFGEDGTYYYVDDIASKVRWIVMDTNGGSVDSTQIAWVQNTALNITESGWGVVFISHQPICNAYHSGITNAANVISAVTSTASSKNLPIIGWYSGHVHRDRIYTKLLTGGNGSNAGTPTTDLGFTQVVITSDHTGIAYDNDDGTVSDTKHTIANDDKSHAIDFVTINKTTRTVSITRLGIGSDRSYTY